MPTTAVLLLLFLHASAAHSRRILHQPFFPLDSLPPTQPPTPSPTPPPTPKYPFSASTPDNTTVNSPFFPLYPSPPPSPPSTPPTFASFPANISSLTLPPSSKSKPSSKLAIVAVAAVIAAVAVVSLAAFLHFRNKRRRSNPPSPPPTKSTPRSSNTNSSTTSHRRPPASNHRVNSHVPKLQRPSQTSSEFLYLGTLVNSHAPLVPNNNNNNSARNTISSNNNLGSPELRPLPPLSGPQNSEVSYRNADVAQSSRYDDDDEEFYSPKGSRGTSTIATGSASARDFNAINVRNVNGSSSTYSSSASVSPERSVSLSLSPAHSSSSRNSIPKSPDLIELQHIAALGGEGNSQYDDSFNRESACSLLSPSPPSSSKRYFARMSQESSSPKTFSAWDNELGDSLSNLHSQVQDGCSVVENLPQSSVERFPAITDQRSSSPRTSNVSNHNVDDSNSNVNSSTQIALPPPPPPPPPQPRKLWDSPKTPTPPTKKAVLAPPSLVKPLMPIPMDGSTLISPMKLPSNDESNSGTPMEEMDRSTEEAVDQNKEDLDSNLKPKLKPLHWDKVRANSDKEMVWDQLKCSSFKLNEEMIETLFVVNNPNPKQSPKEAMRWQVLPSPSGDTTNKVLDPKKSQNIAILLRALNVTIEEVCDGLLEGNTDTLSTDLLESLLKMAPTKEEERKLKEHKDDSPIKLGAAERFLKAVLDVPHAFKRLEAMLYVSNFESEVEYLKKSFVTLEAACEELRTSRMFLKLLEAVLKTGNRMNVGTNRGDAQAFKLDTLLKLVDVKGADGKTTLLHFVVQEIIRTEGARISENSNSTLNDEAKCRKLGLQVVSGLSSELSNVKKSATMDAEVLSSDILKLSDGIKKIVDAIKLTEEEHRPSSMEGGSSRFSESMDDFLKRAEEELIKLQAQESVASSLVKEVTEYFHGNSTKEEAHPFRIFMVVRDFLGILDRVCKEVGMINERTTVSSAYKFPVPVNPLLQQASGGFFNRPPQFTAFNDDERCRYDGGFSGWYPFFEGVLRRRLYFFWAMVKMQLLFSSMVMDCTPKATLEGYAWPH